MTVSYKTQFILFRLLITFGLLFTLFFSPEYNAANESNNDASAESNIEKAETPKEFDLLSKKGIIKVMPAKVKADGFILQLSESENLMILSNDLFKEFRIKHDWVDSKRIPYSILHGNFYLHPLYQNT